MTQDPSTFPEMPDVPPEMPDVGGQIPDVWLKLIDHLGEVSPTSPRRQELEARLQVWLLFSNLRSRRLMAKDAQEHAKALADTALAQAETEAESADRTAKSLRKATWTLVFVTVVLSVATIAAAFIARSPR